MRRCALLLVAALALAGCSASSADDEPSAPSKYDQTWTTPYSETTCAQWQSEMTDAQQWAASADMLAGARNKGDGGTGLPSDALVDEFQSGVTTACVIDTYNIAEVGAALYVTERDRFRP